MLFSGIIFAALCLASAGAWAAPELGRLEREVERAAAETKSAGFSSPEILGRAKAGEQGEWLARADAMLKKQQSSYDELAKAELTHLLESAEVVVAEVNADPVLGAAEKKSIQKLGKFAGEFRANAALYGTGRDYFRKTAYQNYFAEFKVLSDRLNRKPLGARLKARLASIVEMVRMALAAIPDAPAFFRKLYMPGKDEELITAKLYDMLKGFGQRSGFSVDVKGREKLPATSRKIINVYAPTHRLAVNDAIIMAEIAPRDSLLFMAPRNFLPGMLAKQIEKVPGFIAVGKGQEPLQVAMASLEKSGAQNIFIYPEGSLPAGIMDNAPVREKFGTGLIAGLRAAGFEVNLVPISYQNSARFLNKATKEPGAKNLKAEIHEAIPDSVLGAWEKYDPTFLNRYLRAVHLEGLETSDTQLMGMLRPSALQPELIRHLGACPGHFSLLKK